MCSSKLCIGTNHSNETNIQVWYQDDLFKIQREISPGKKERREGSKDRDIRERRLGVKESGRERVKGRERK